MSDKKKTEGVQLRTKQLIALVLVVALACVGIGLSVSSRKTIGKDSIELQSTQFQPTAKRMATVSMLAVGDNLIHKPIYQQAQARTDNGSYDFMPVYENLKSIISGADIAVINQETMMSSLHEVATYPCFNTPVVMAQTLADLGFDVLSLANNHMLDKASKGLISTLDLVNSTKGLTAAGAYHSREEYTDIKIKEVKGITFAFLSYTEHTNGITLPADKEDYIIYLSELEDVKQQVEYADKAADVVVVSMHAGVEYSDEYHAVQSDFAQNVADWGADLVIGTHPHTLQPVEYITAASGKEVPVLYSLGNFVSAQDKPKRLIGGMANITFTKDFSTGEVTVGKPALDIVITHYKSGYSGLKLYRLADYTDTLAAANGVGGLSLDYIYEHIRNIIGDEYLIDEYKSKQ